MRVTLQRQMIISSVFFFVVMAVGIFILFSMIMTRNHAEQQALAVANKVETKKESLVNSVDREIVLAMKMAGSPLIKRFFIDEPGNVALKELALEEIASFQDAFSDGIIFWVSDRDKDFYYNMEYSYTVDPLNPDDYWYKMTLFETEKYNLNINYNSEIDAIMLWVNAPVFDHGTPIGMVGTGVNLSNFISFFFQNDEDGLETVFFNDNGEITGAKSLTLVSEKASIFDQYAYMRDELQEILSGDEDLSNPFSFHFKIGKTELRAAILEIEEIGWYVLAFPEEGSKTSFADIFYILVIMFSMLVCVFVVFNVIVRFRLINRLTPIREALALVASGDLTVDAGIDSSDELGELNNYLKKINTGLSSIIKDIGDQVGFVDELEDSLQKMVTETTDAVEEIVENIKRTGSDVDKQKTNIVDNVTWIEKMSRSIDVLIGLLKEQTSSIEKSSDAIENLTDQISFVGEANQKSREVIYSLEEVSKDGLDNLLHVSDLAKDISEKSNVLMETNSIMANIAQQTNLLSMNAAIEAAHAGDAGRGFSVVAEEIRKLADQSASQSEEVASTIAGIKEDIEKMVDASDATSQSFEKIDEEVKRVGASFQNVAEKMDILTEKGSEVSSYLSQMEGITRQVEKGSSEMSTGNRSMLDSLQSFKQGSEDITDAVANITQHIGRIKDYVDHISSQSTKNVEQISRIKVNIERFKLV